DILLSAKEYGTLEALEEIDSPSEVKFGLVVGGVTTRDYPHLRTVTALAKEHLHLLGKGELAGNGLSGLLGNPVALGPPTTAPYHVARDVLNFSGVLPAVEAKSGEDGLHPRTPQETLREMARIGALDKPARAEAIARLPDAVMFLAP